MGSEITWQLLQSILTTAAESPLGVFLNTAAGGAQQFTLALDTAFVADLSAGGLVSLHVLPQTGALGFTFHSRNFGEPSQRPQLLLTAAPRIRGDMNCDDQLDAADVAPFVLSLVNPAAYEAMFVLCPITRADFMQDGSVDGRDIAGFISALLSP